MSTEHAWPQQLEAKDAGCTCGWHGTAIIDFDPTCPLLLEHKDVPTIVRRLASLIYAGEAMATELRIMLMDSGHLGLGTRDTGSRYHSQRGLKLWEPAKERVRPRYSPSDTP